MFKKAVYVFWFVLVLGVADNGKGAVIFFEELFDDTNTASRGWYDGSPNGSFLLSTTEHIPGSISSAEFHFTPGATTPTTGGARRKLFTETETVYLSFYIKHSTNWTGSNHSYHPHQFQFLTNLNGTWTGPAYTYSTYYVETNEGEPLLALQDSQNIDETKIGIDLTGITEERAIAGCNGNSDGTAPDDCYPVGSVHRNGKGWRAGSIYFQHNPGSYYKNDWHFVETYFQLNSIVGGIGIADGHVKYWYDGELIIDFENVMLRTGEHPGMRIRQLLIAPWIGDGSPVDQTFWIDNLTVADSRPIPGDIDNSGDVNLDDFAEFALAWSSELGDPEWSLDYELSQPPDGVINAFDLGVFADNWLSGN
ncbi:MAG: hypothetical protein ACYS1A_10505 [Planctomycetota bacterium]|jgi:hypothetical protein